MSVRRSVVRGWFTAAFISLLLVTSTPLPAMAQKASGWVPDQRVPGYLDDTFTPFLLADQNRNVHAFASQWVGTSPRQLAIVYRRWSLTGGWTKPVDILLPPVGEAQIQGAFLDSSGIMHVIFWAGNSKEAYIFYSRAPVTNADQSSAWSPPYVIGEKAVEPASASLAGDDQGNIIIIYTGNLDGAGVYEVHSKDSGNNWTKSRPVFLTYEIGLVPYSLRLYLGQEGQLHAAWNVVTNKGVDMSLHYARYDVKQEEWTEPVMLNKRIDIKDYFGPSFPSIVDNGEDVVIMYNNGNPFSGRPVPAGRPVQMVNVSNDGGQTWRDPVVPFYRLLGRSGEHSLVVDSNQVVHALFTQRIEYVENGANREIGGMWHSSYQDRIWSDPDRFITSHAPHDVRAVVSQGNVLLVVWREDPGAEHQHGVWFSYTILDSPELPVVIPPTPLSNDTLIPTPDFASGSTVVAVPTTETPVINLEGAPTGIASNPAGSLIVALVPVLLVLAGVVMMYQFYRSRTK